MQLAEPLETVPELQSCKSCQSYKTAQEHGSSGADHEPPAELWPSRTAT